MATIKMCTDIPQSKVLAEILPIESADMYYDRYGTPNVIDNIVTHKSIKTDKYQHLIPCWSLAALIGILPSEFDIIGKLGTFNYKIEIRKYKFVDNINMYQITYGNSSTLSGKWKDMVNTMESENLIDCCVNMILILKERNLI